MVAIITVILTAVVAFLLIIDYYLKLRLEDISEQLHLDPRAARQITAGQNPAHVHTRKT